MARIEFLLNGEAVRVENPAPQMTLLDFVRARGLTGAKEGCAEGECGACAVALVERESDSRSAYRVVNSCLMFLPMAAGREIHTVESLAEGGELCDAQRAMADGGRIAVRLLHAGLCRQPVRRAVSPRIESAPATRWRWRAICAGAPAIVLFAMPRVRSGRRRATGSVRGWTSRPLRFTRWPSPDFPALRRSTSAWLCLQAHADATLVAGATDLGVESNLLARRWPHLISVEAIDELQEFSSTARSVRIGAALPLNEIGRRWRDSPDVFHEWLTLFASPLIRNRATLGGNLATASPIGDAAPLLLALDAVMHVAGAAGRRTVPMSSFFTAYRRTALTSDELIIAVEIPKPLPQFVQFYKVAKRRLDDISTVAAAMAPGS